MKAHGPIAWIDEPGPQGSWGSPDDLGLPLSDRGLLLAEGLFETVLVEEGQPWLLSEHLARLERSAALLALPAPPTAALLKPLVGEAIERSGIHRGALRLNWSRGSSIDPLARGLSGGPCRPRCWLQLSPGAPSFEPATVIVSPSEGP